MITLPRKQPLNLPKPDKYYNRYGKGTQELEKTLFRFSSFTPAKGRAIPPGIAAI